MNAVIFLNRYFHPDHSATSQLLSDLAFDLARAGRDVHVITSRQRYDDACARLPAREDVQGVRVHRVWTTRFGRARLLGRALDYASFYLAATWSLLRLARRGDWVVAKTDPPLVSVPAALIAQLRGARLVNWLQDLFPEVAHVLGVPGMVALAPPLTWLRNLSLRAAAFNVVLGERMAERVRAAGVPARRIRVVHNWSDGALIRPIERRRNPLSVAWGVGERFVVGYSGNMGRAHEFHTVLDAAALLAADAATLLFVFIGGGARRDWLERECASRGLRNVMFQPYQPRASLAEALSLPDVHLASLYPALEGLIVPSKFYGIAAAGRPVIYIGAANGEVPQLLRAGDCGATVAPGDGSALAATLWRLADNPAEARRLGDNARRLFERRFDRPLALRAWSEVLASPAVRRPYPAGRATG